MIKKLILITGLMLSASLWADFEHMCDLSVIDNPRSYEDVPKLISLLRCREGDILNVTEGRNFVQVDEQETVARHCDLEETIHKTNMGFVCILANVRGLPVRKSILSD